MGSWGFGGVHLGGWRWLAATSRIHRPVSSPRCDSPGCGAGAEANSPEFEAALFAAALATFRRPMIHRPYQALAAAKWLAVLLPMAAVIGSASAFFLWSLDALTRVRFAHPGLLWLLPLGGFAVGWIYHYYGKAAGGGNNLLIDEIHEPGAGVPRRMAPLILLGTLVTHLFGGSAGREGTAVQMGGGIAATFARVLKLDAASVRLLLMAGVAAGFGSIFGTPIAGTVFALEVLVIGRMQYDALMPCFIASLVADWTCGAWGIGHTHYHGADRRGRACGRTCGCSEKSCSRRSPSGWRGPCLPGARTDSRRRFQTLHPAARTAAGGRWLAGHRLVFPGRHARLPRPRRAGQPARRPHPAGDVHLGRNLPATAWMWKLVFTVVTLSAGFKGGEVTPLFFIGAALGHTLAVALRRPGRSVCRAGICRHLRRGHQHPAGVHLARHGTLRCRQWPLPRHRLHHRLPLQRPYRHLLRPTPRRPEIPRPAARQVTCLPAQTRVITAPRTSPP